ncbi:hypothetical protein [Pelagicoccus mobilis]
MVGHATIELLAYNHIRYLREDETASIHARQSHQGQNPLKSNSNASHASKYLSP